jgi:hypothetical protein
MCRSCSRAFSGYGHPWPPEKVATPRSRNLYRAARSNKLGNDGELVV